MLWRKTNGWEGGLWQLGFVEARLCVYPFFHQNSYINHSRFNITGKQMREFDVVLLEDETGSYVAIVPALQGCHTQGDTLSEAIDNVKEAIDLYMETY
jgi:hypothetical protein